jgi:hypothetical protein
MTHARRNLAQQSKSGGVIGISIEVRPDETFGSIEIAGLDRLGRANQGRFI